jgi:hypothetical protein
VKKHIKAAAVLAAVTALAACGSSPAAQAPKAVSSSRMPWIPPAGTIGMTGQGMPASFSSEVSFAKATGVKPGIVSYYSGWWEPYRTAFAEQVSNAGAVVLVNIDSSGASLTGIAAGRNDTYLKAFGRAIQAAGKPVIVSFDHEANGSWFSYGYKHVTPAQFVAAWRHVHDVIDSQTSLVTWLWTMNIPAPGRTEPYAPLYPGSEYVDIAGVDGYDWSGKKDFAELFGGAVAEIRKAAPGKPVMIPETSVVPGPDAATQVGDLFAGVKASNLLGFLWFDVSRKGVKGSQDQHDWRLESDPAALAAYRVAVKAAR